MAANTAAPTGAGIGLRLPHLNEVVAVRPNVPWFEVHPENFIANPHATELLEKVRGDYPISIHTVGVSIGSVGGIDREHLAKVRALVDRIEPFAVSGHLAWSTHAGEYLNDLLPLPYNEETLALLVRHVDAVQEGLGRPYLVENPSSYVGFAGSTMNEVEFLSELVARSGCRLLCDVSNIHVSGHNMGYDPVAYIAGLPADAIGELHLGGFEIEADEPNAGTVIVDTHSRPIAAEAWRLYDCALRRFGPRPTLIEWDNDLPALDTLVAEAARADGVAAAVFGEPPAVPPLAEAQGALRDAIVAGDARAILPLLTGGRDPSYRLSVHQRHYAASLVDLLRKRFPALEWLVGEPFLKAAATAYIRRAPPRRPALGAYGEDFPAFLAAQPAAQSMPWLAEVGALEWALAEVAVALELPAIGLEEFAAFADSPLEAVCLRLQPGLAYLDCAWGVDELVKLHLEGNAPDELTFVPQAVTLEARGSRGAFSFRRIDDGTRALRGALARGAPLATALADAAAADPALDAGAAFAALFAEGLVTDIAARDQPAGGR